MEIMNNIINITFFASVLYILYIIFLLVQKMIDFFVLNNEKTTFVLTNTQRIILWISFSLILNKIF